MNHNYVRLEELEQLKIQKIIHENYSSEGSQLDERFPTYLYAEDHNAQGEESSFNHE